MANSASRPCKHQGCGALVRDGSGYCSAHQGDRRIGKFGDSRRGSRHERGYGTDWDKRRKRILARDHGLCQPCLKEGAITAATQVDHIINKEAWRARHGNLVGCDDEQNLQSICDSCHQRKTAAEAVSGRGVSKV